MNFNQSEETQIIMQMLTLAATGIDDESLSNADKAVSILTRLVATASMAIGGSFPKEHMVEAVADEFAKRLKEKSVEFYALTHGGPLDPKNHSDTTTTH